jgi:hypothetical protein
MFTTGRDGLEGTDTVTEVEGLESQLSQTESVDTPWHLAFKGELGFTLKEDPTSNDPELEDSKKLLSSTQTQTVESVMVTESEINKDLQRNEFVNPPRFVGESNSTTILVPSFEKAADRSRGGGGAASPANTVKSLPFGNFRTELTLEDGDEGERSTSSS